MKKTYFNFKYKTFSRLSTPTIQKNTRGIGIWKILHIPMNSRAYSALVKDVFVSACGAGFSVRPHCRTGGAPPAYYSQKAKLIVERVGVPRLH